MKLTVPVIILLHSPKEGRSGNKEVNKVLVGVVVLRNVSGIVFPNENKKLRTPTTEDKRSELVSPFRIVDGSLKGDQAREVHKRTVKPGIFKKMIV